MPKRSIYFKEDEDKLYLRVKELTADSSDTIASIFVKAMQEYVVAKEDEFHGDDPIEIFVGESVHGFMDTGDNVRFFGKEIAAGSYDSGQHETTKQVVYRTRKGKFALYEIVADDNASKYTLDVIDGAKGLMKRSLAPGIMAALKEINVGTKVLDI